MRKPIVQAVFVGLLFVVVFYVFHIILGMFLTANYVPDIIETYETVDELQHKVSFGSETSPLWRAVEAVGIMLLGIIVYFTVRKISRTKHITKQ